MVEKQTKSSKKGKNGVKSIEVPKLSSKWSQTACLSDFRAFWSRL
jgi:hypothetical protein